jgi:hypothetical protein
MIDEDFRFSFCTSLVSAWLVPPSVVIQSSCTGKDPFDVTLIPAMKEGKG